MHTIISCIIFSLVIGLQSVWANDAKTVHLASIRDGPYIGPHLYNQGYVYQLVEEAFAEEGYRIQVDYFSITQSLMEARSGYIDGVAPVYYNPALENDFVISKPFPGNSVGLLRKKPDSKISNNTRVASTADILDNKKDWRLGIVRSLPVAQQLKEFDFDWSLNNLQNIDKLMTNRVDLAVIDKYSSTHILSTYRPQYIGKLEFLNPPITRFPFYLAISKTTKNHNEIVEKFNVGLRKLQDKGRVKELLTLHGLSPVVQTQKDKVNLTIGAVSNADFYTLQLLSEEYRKLNPNVNIVWQFLPENTLRLRLLSDLAISEGKYDIMTIGSYEVPIWSEWGWIKPIDTLPREYKVKDMMAPVKKTMSFRKQLHALPFYSESTVLYYRRDLFKEKTLSMPKNPSFNTVLKFAKQLHNPKKGMAGICLRGKVGWGENMAIVTTMLKSYGGKWFDQHWMPQLNSKAWHDSLNMYVALNQYTPERNLYNGYIENFKLFKEGRCAMWFDSTVAAGEVFNANVSPVAAHVDIVYAPHGDVTSSQWWWTWAFAIPSSSKQSEEALKFITWATSQEYIQLVAQKRGWTSIPAGTRTSSYKNKNYKNFKFAKYTQEAIQASSERSYNKRIDAYDGIQWVGIPEFPAIAQQVGEQIAELIQEKQSLEDTLAKSQAIVLEQMQSSGYIEVSAAAQ